MPTGPITRRFGDSNFGHPIKYIFEGRDDENIVNKTLVMTKHTGLLAGFRTLVDVVCVNEHKGVTHALQRTIHNSRSMVGGGLAYMALMNVAASVRNKNDDVNHFWGGIGWGLIFGAHTKSIQSGIYCAIIIGLTGMVYKDYVLEGGDLLSENPEIKEHGFAMAHKMDFSLWGDRPSYWVRTQEEADEIVRTSSRVQHHVRTPAW